MGFTEDCFRDSDEDICRQAIESSKPSMQGIEWESLKAKGWQRLNVPERFAPFAKGGFATPPEVRVLQRDRDRDGMDPLPMYIRHASPRSRTPRSRRSTARHHLSAHRHFLNSSFANMPFATAEAKEPSLDMHVADAAARGIGNGDTVRIFNDRGSFTARARVGEKARDGVVVALSVWWRKLTGDGRNANEVTSQALTDIGRGATFYDCLVEVERTVARGNG